jgi:NAD(P)H-dependent flavin oxidoreductase YrpB (nitropropane dioxygenase family)
MKSKTPPSQAESETMAILQKASYTNEYTRKHLELEARGASFDELREFEHTCPSLGEWRRLPGALIAGNIEEGTVAMGAGAALIKEVLAAGQVVRRIVKEHDEVVKRQCTEMLGDN